MLKGVYETQGHEVVIKETKGRWQPIGGCLLGTAAFAGLLLYGINSHAPVALAVGILATLIILPATAYLIYRAARDQPALVIGERGFTDHASLTGVGYVAWDEVAGIRLDRVWLTMRLHDPGPVIARQPAWRRAFIRMNSRVVAGDIIIPTNALSMSPPELLNLMIDKLQRSSEAGR